MSIRAIVVLYILLVAIPVFAIRPRTNYERTPATVGITYDSLNIPTVANKRLTAWLCHSSKDNKDKKLVILAGPDAGNMSDELDLVQAITSNLPVDVLLFDYRGFGMSDLIPIDSDLIAMPEFEEDISSVLKYASTHLVKETSKLFLYGRSMGASLSIVAGSALPGLGGVVAESPYTSQSALQKYYSSLYHKTQSNRSVRLIRSKVLEPMENIRALKCPLLLMHGEQENQISSNEISKLFAACSVSGKSLWIAAGAGHMEVPYKHTSTFLTMFYTFIQ